MFLGIDHGTNAMRFAAINGVEEKHFEIPRTEISQMNENEILPLLLDKFDITENEIELIAVTYSMGDGITCIENVKNVKNRGVQNIEGVGKKTGAGTLVFDAVLHSDIPTVVIPGIHEKSSTDPRMNVFSHSTSPEKLGIAYNAFCTGVRDFIVSDMGSNTVTLGVVDGKVVGAIDACIFAPGTNHGPLDLQAIRDVDAGKCTANEAFMNSGVLKQTPYSTSSELITAFTEGKKDAAFSMDCLALFASMEISAMQVLLKDYDVKESALFLAGSIGEVGYVQELIAKYTGSKPQLLGKWSAALGSAMIARDIASGKAEILGIPVNF
ncbi:putative methanogenesis marker protein 12 [Methanohalophilus levihalophilus]|uniref:methanogenesis marker 12 protein n=1 Tax=Methanohalophilus levihalophilus TaxID=1431282 RepID=UPI001AE2014E|nr:methanogenesis marker 12 protein [Methanohalophilus levihalophilus]MBP2029424.1 putative methanogenesis marker protein 12 [Methanohalophilus levihalophilus]